MAKSSLGQPCVPEPRRELGQRTALLALIRHPGLLAEAPGRAGSISALMPPRMRDYRAERRGAEQDFFLLAVFLQMRTARLANGLASCNYPVSPGEERTILQPNLIGLNLLQNCLRLLGSVYILLVLPRPPRGRRLR